MLHHVTMRGTSGTFHGLFQMLISVEPFVPPGSSLLLLRYDTVHVSLDPPHYVYKAINKIRRAFLWKGKDAVEGGKCLVNWDTLCHPKSQGGMGLMNLENMSNVFKVRWEGVSEWAGRNHGMISLQPRQIMLGKYSILPPRS
jgi:hypothetical protein